MILSFAELVFAVFGIHHSFDDLYLGVQLASAYLRARRTTFKTFAELVSLRIEWQAEEDDWDEPALLPVQGAVRRVPAPRLAAAAAREDAEGQVVYLARPHPHSAAAGSAAWL